MRYGTKGPEVNGENFRTLHFKNSYIGEGSSILKDFLLPVLSASVSYDRVTSFFTVDSLIAISQGIESIYSHSGHMRLIIGLHSCPEELAEIQLNKDFLRKKVEKIRHDIETGLKRISDTLVQEKLATISWMIEDGLLSVKVASVPEGIFHPKTIICTDVKGDKVVAVGSPNETPYGLGGNFEQLLTLKSWEHLSDVSEHTQFFENLWNDRLHNVSVIEITDQVASLVMSSLANKKKGEEKHLSNAFSIAQKMPANFFVSGLIPSLYPHQECAVLDALSRWPVRVLFCDEVGLGKTFESAATMAFLIRFCGVKNVVLLTPKAVLHQWQEELSEHFGIDAWLFDSSKQTYISSRGKLYPISHSGPLAKGTPEVKIISAQYARGLKGKTIFDSPSCVLPDLLILDEAHSARISIDISGKHKATKIHSMLMEVSQKIPHIILATATPMQKDAEEYHSLLMILGLPKTWEKRSNYLTSLKLISKSSIVERQTAFDAGKMLKSVLDSFNPDLSAFSSSQRKQLLALKNCTSPIDIAEITQDGWENLREPFIRLHPAHLFTIRNTRDVLSQFGYHFPNRKLVAEEVEQTIEIKRFYYKVETFLADSCFSVEMTLHPGKKPNIGFLKVNYRQRISSSLRSCARSLRRRMEKLKEIKNSTGIGEKLFLKLEAIGVADALDDDDMLSRGIDVDAAEAVVSPEELELVVSDEITKLAPLVETAEELAEKADPKIDRALAICRQKLEENNQILVFSRYTDTIQSLLLAVEKRSLNVQYNFAVYTGQEATLYIDGCRTQSSKIEIQEKLKSKQIDFILCSDAASEGLNLQSARVLINVDVPWTPSRLEQRIGRVARLGQMADTVEIFNIWYPNSIEAKMYRRIGDRLNEARLAVGDFPDIVADSIRKQLITGDIDDNKIDSELKEIRKKSQYGALKRIWSIENPNQTHSGIIREKLLDLCKKNLSHKTDGSTYIFSSATGESCRANALNGDADAISYASKCLQWVPSKIKNATVDRDQDGIPRCFQRSDDLNHYIDFTDIPNVASGSDGKMLQFAQRPQLLPNMGKLNLSFKLENSVFLAKPPKLWR